jgi:3-ketosteroid 9alpha-monooxygenase subunit B
MPESTPQPPRRDHGFHEVRVHRVIEETGDAVSVELEVPEDLRDAFQYQSGQFLTFRLKIDGQQVLRSYSMSSSPAVDTNLQVTVKRVDGGVVSTWMTGSLSAGDLVEVTLPAGVFTLGSSDGPIVAFAGGSGITPVYSLIKTAMATTSRPVKLLYANRDRDATIFRDELDALAEKYGDRLELLHHWDADSGFANAEIIGTHTGHATSAPLADADYYICGPAPFMDLVEATLHGHDVAADRIHIERFTPVAPVEPPEIAAEEAAAGPSQVTIELDGKTETAAHRAGTTILQTARSMGLIPPYSCEAGDCATCMAKMVEGTADMFANNALMDDEVEDGWILTCQAVPTSPTIHVIYGYEE